MVLVFINKEFLEVNQVLIHISLSVIGMEINSLGAQV